MTNPDTTPAPPPAATAAAPPAATASPTGRGLKLALALSVAVNLGIAGLATGAWLKEGSGGRAQGMMGFAPFSEAMSPQDRQALRRAMLSRAAELSTGREAAKTEFTNLVTALRDDEADPAAVQAALSAIATRNAGRLDLAHDLIEAHLLGLSGPERHAFADRLEAALQRRD